MSLDKAIKHGREKRRKYRGAKACDSSCRNHGDCPWCSSNRLYKDKRRKAAARDKEELWEMQSESISDEMKETQTLGEEIIEGLRDITRMI